MSIEWSVGGRRFVTDTGVDRYQAGAERDFQRGTAAHSTLQVGRLDQGEPFGSFRMGRRPKVRGERTGEASARGEHDGFGAHGLHTREISWGGARGFRWVDAVHGPREVEVAVRLGSAPGSRVALSSRGAVLERADGVSVAWTVPSSGRTEVENGVLCEGFGVSEPRPVALWRGDAGRGRALPFALDVIS